MRFSFTIACTFAVANASTLQAEATQLGAAPHSHGPEYFHYPAHAPADYSHQYDEILPGADFNRQVWEFDQHAAIWNQNDYTERVKMEAEILVALEALKESIVNTNHEVDNLFAHLQHDYERINSNKGDIYAEMAANSADFEAQLERIHYL